VNSSLDRLFGARLVTPEAHLFARHFGLANVLIAFFCNELLRAGSATPQIKVALVIWHGSVVAAFMYEFLARRVWHTSPLPTRLISYGGVVSHAIIFCEGLLETGMVSSLAYPMSSADPTSDWLRSAALECSLERRLMLGFSSAASFALIYDPVGRLLLRRQKSINDGHLPVPRYWTIVVGSLCQIAMWIAASTRFLPTFANVRFRAAEASVFNMIPATLLCMLIAEFGFYWSHRLFHSRWLYRHVHSLHHRIEAPTSAYDALYQDPVEMEVNLFLTYLPLAIVPIHIYAVVCYLYLSGFIAFVLNHSGREYEFRVPTPFTENRYVLWSTRLHDDHHAFRRGNYGAQLWCFDDVFGTRVTKSKPKTRGKRRWTAISIAFKVITHVGTAVA